MEEEIKDAEYEELENELAEVEGTKSDSGSNDDDSHQITEEDIKRMWTKMHTPIICKIREPRRNDICPYCNSGKKYKNCECSKNHENVYEYDYQKTKGFPS